MLLFVALGFAGIFIAERQIRGATRTSVLWLMFVVAVPIRALLLPLPPSLSGDIDRYLWDGRVLTAGENPYLLEPDALELEALRDDRWVALDHRDVPTVYPPLAQVLFALASRLPHPALSLKATLVLLDLLTCASVAYLARRWNVPAERILWYAWNPLVTIEIAAMGHIDGLGVTWMVVTTALLARPARKIAGAAVGAAAAVASKLVPLVAIPVWARQSRMAWRFGWLALLLSAVGLAPMLVAAGGLPPGLIAYGVSWEFNGPLFEPLWRLLQAIDLHGLVETGLDGLKTITGRHDFWNLFYPWNYPQLWAKVLLLFGVGIVLWRAWRASTTLASLQGVFGGVLLCSATVYPWYGLWVLPWAALGRSPAWLALSGLLLLSYLPQFWNVPSWPWVYVLIWVPFAALKIRFR